MAGHPANGQNAKLRLAFGASQLPVKIGELQDQTAQARDMGMTTLSSTTSPLQAGTVVRLNPNAGFGYVRDQKGDHQYIFVFGTTIRRSVAKSLSIGMAVHFRVSGQGKVDELRIDEPHAAAA